MTATIIQFRKRAKDTLRVPELGQMLTSALPLLPLPSELQTLLESAAQLLDNLNEAELDKWLTGLDHWETKNAEWPSA